MRTTPKASELIRNFEHGHFREIPKLAIGDTVNLKVQIQEGNRVRIQSYQGTIISRHRAGLQTTITVRKTFQGVGVERVFPIHSPQITAIEVIKHAYVRRSKLYYLRGRSGKAARLRTRITD
uniref:Large ribosomal subunit protein bL19c n=1 Tax=Chloroparvula japonica TaxID=1411623 RepID=A0A4D6C2Z6_9CHLO|nr:ribosomal protein L19 [Chloroparvula japonica]QBX98136.1 ribosomal protein L19 [Chloroparvula japonica]